VEPHRRVERRDLVQQDPRELRFERVAVLVRGEVAELAAPARDRAGHAADHLLDRALALRRVEPAAEVLLRDDVRRVLRPRGRELDALLLEAADLRVAQLPVDGRERVYTGFGEAPLDGQSLTLRGGVGGGASYLRH